MQGVFNPNILIYHPPNSTEGLHFSAFSLLYGRVCLSANTIKSTRKSANTRNKTCGKLQYMLSITRSVSECSGECETTTAPTQHWRRGHSFSTCVL